jgi:oligopeptide transport system substrate-binding protein
MKRPATLAAAALILSACTEIQRPQPEQYYGAAASAPIRQELRWSNGKVPRSLDPARAAAAPETDLVRAVYEGLTDLDSRTLEPRPALAERWTTSDDHRTWTFELRKNARWTNGKRVTAHDVVASWKRVLRLGKKSPNADLFRNIVGADIGAAVPSPDKDFDSLQTPVPSPTAPVEAVDPQPARSEQPPASRVVPTQAKFGAEAIDDVRLRVTLRLPDKDLPKLVASTVFRPIYGSGDHFETEGVNNGIVTNGPFRVALVSKEGVTLERSDSYWNRSAVRLDGVKFVATETAEGALEAYKRGELDAVTNAELEPLAIKLLAPFEDFRQTRHNAVNLYEVNAVKPPFNDRRVREALATAIDREKLIVGELEGATEPASTLLPLSPERPDALSFDPVRSRDLMEKAGFPAGDSFPAIRLVVNRNNTQLRIARTVAQMWKQHLNVDTEIVVRETSEMDAIRNSGDFDLIRRGIVLPTADELVGMISILGSVVRKPVPADPTEAPQQAPARPDAPVPHGPSQKESEATDAPSVEQLPELVTADEALHEVEAIPLYFPVSYALVKPYLSGFELNALDTYSLQDVAIVNDWRPGEANVR